jgi:hypothetical protein
MMDGTNRMEFLQVEVVNASGWELWCRVGDKVVGISPHRLLPGTTIGRSGDIGTLVLERTLAMALDLA